MASTFYKISISDPVTGNVTAKKVKSRGIFYYRDELFFLHIDLSTKTRIAVSHVETGFRAVSIDRYAGLYNLTYKPVEKSEHRVIEEAVRKFDAIPENRFIAGIERARLTNKNSGA
jgi:hypothetical protein